MPAYDLIGDSDDEDTISVMDEYKVKAPVYDIIGEYEEEDTIDEPYLSSFGITEEGYPE